MARHGMFTNCECGHCQIVAGKSALGNCAICHNSGVFTIDDLIHVAGLELWAHPECRRDWKKVHDLEIWLEFGEHSADNAD